MTKHTPGPWRVIAGDSVVHVVAETETVCATNRKTYYQKHDETDVANAHLIAAAPDLLSALQRLVQFDESDSDDVLEARAAIAKAIAELPPSRR